MHVLTNLEVEFDGVNCGKIEVTMYKNLEGVIELKQGNDVVWIPIEDADAFAEALKAFAKARAA